MAQPHHVFARRQVRLRDIRIQFHAVPGLVLNREVAVLPERALAHHQVRPPVAPSSPARECGTRAWPRRRGRTRSSHRACGIVSTRSRCNTDRRDRRSSSIPAGRRISECRCAPRTVACISISLRKPCRPYRFSPVQTGTLMACVTRAMASMLSGGTGSSSHIGFTGSSSRPRRITSCVSYRQWALDAEIARRAPAFRAPSPCP